MIKEGVECLGSTTLRNTTTAGWKSNIKAWRKRLEDCDMEGQLEYTVAKSDDFISTELL